MGFFMGHFSWNNLTTRNFFPLSLWERLKHICFRGEGAIQKIGFLYLLFKYQHITTTKSFVF